jgi:hypothetical protein
VIAFAELFRSSTVATGLSSAGFAVLITTLIGCKALSTVLSCLYPHSVSVMEKSRITMPVGD